MGTIFRHKAGPFSLTHCDSLVGFRICETRFPPVYGQDAHLRGIVKAVRITSGLARCFHRTLWKLLTCANELTDTGEASPAPPAAPRPHSFQCLQMPGAHEYVSLHTWERWACLCESRTNRHLKDLGKGRMLSVSFHLGPTDWFFLKKSTVDIYEVTNM